VIPVIRISSKGKLVDIYGERYFAGDPIKLSPKFGGMENNAYLCSTL
jgi:hypothetical protein